MKKMRFFFVLTAITLLMTGCSKDDDVLSFDKFIVNPPTLSTNTKSYLDVDFTSRLSRILYQDGDVIYVSGKAFTLHYEDGAWMAVGSESVSGTEFYCIHADGNISGTGEPSYDVSFTGNLSTTSGVVLVGTTTSNVLTFQPAVAMLVFKPENMGDYTGVKVGFDGSKIPQTFTINASSESYSSVTYMPKAASAYSSSSMLTMKKDPSNTYFYVAVPIAGASVSTKLYVQFYKSDATTEQRITSGLVTLTKGKVHIIPSDNMEDYPFDEFGCGRSTFSVAAGKHVKFSAGNLECNPSLYNFGRPKAWIIPSQQYEQLSYAYNVGISEETNHYIDVFGWATSGYISELSGDHYPYLTETNNALYYAGDENGDLSGNRFYDWGTYNARYNQIYYGDSASILTPASARWSTLTNAEWEYLLNSRSDAANLRGGATINSSIRGLVILPDDWSTPSGASFTPGANNTYTLQQWAVMEKAGAIFLPACGQRTDASTVDGWNEYGYYWTGTHFNASRCYAVRFQNNGTTVSVTTSLRSFRYTGMSVRLVSHID